MEEDSDTQLLRRFAARGDEAAFTELVERHGPMVRGVALRCTGGDRELTEEITQSVFTVLARKASFVPSARLAGWLHNTAVLEAKNALRKAGRHRRAVRELSAQTFNAMNTFSPHSPEDAGLWRDIRPHLDGALARLPEKARHPVVLRYFENRSIREIALEAGMSEHAVRKGIERALARLNVLLKRRGVSTTGSALAAMLAGQSLCAPPASAALLAACSLQAFRALPALSPLSKALCLMAASSPSSKTAGALLLLALLLLTAAWLFPFHNSRFPHGERRPVAPESMEARPGTADLSGAPEAPPSAEPEIKLARRGKLVQDRQTGHWRLSREDMEDYLRRHGRDGDALALAFIMTGETDYLEEAIRDAENPSAALSFKCLSFPDRFTEEEMAKLEEVLGPDNAWPALLRVYRDLKRGAPDALAGLRGIALERRVYDPVTPVPGRELFLLAEAGEISLNEALPESRATNVLNGKAFQEIGNALYLSARRAAAAGDFDTARDMLRRGVLLAGQMESGWTHASSANASEAAMLDIAGTHGLTGVWEESNETVREQLREEELESCALSETLDAAVPAMSEEALREWIPLAVSQGQAAMTRAMIEESEPLRLEYLKHLESLRRNRDRLEAEFSGE